jgi:hypothetical protein
MDRFFAPPPPPRRTGALRVWAIATALATLPSLCAWIVRGIAFALQCAPGPQPCNGIALGRWLREILDVAWFIGADSLLGIALAFVAALAALWARRPLLAALSMLLLPIATVLLPTFAVYSLLYSGCDVNEAGVGNCTLWGATMGMSLHHAALAQWLIYGFAPYTFAMALMIGIIGVLFFRER